MTKQNRIEFTLGQMPGQTAREVAESLYGDGAYQQLVNDVCLRMLGASLRREGRGGNGDPFKYYYLSEREPRA